MMIMEKKTGVWTEWWYFNGIKCSAVHYKHGKRQGLCKRRSHQAQIISLSKYFCATKNYNVFMTFVRLK